VSKARLNLAQLISNFKLLQFGPAQLKEDRKSAVGAEVATFLCRLSPITQPPLWWKALSDAVPESTAAKMAFVKLGWPESRQKRGRLVLQLSSMKPQDR